jgi:hypothetical protein
MKCIIKLNFTIIFAIVLIIMAGCKNNNSNGTLKQVDTISVFVDENGNMKVGNRQISVDDLEKTLIDSVNALKKAGFSKIPEFNLVVKGEGMLMGGRAEVNDIFEMVKSEIQ